MLQQNKQIRYIQHDTIRQFQDSGRPSPTRTCNYDVFLAFKNAISQSAINLFHTKNAPFCETQVTFILKVMNFRRANEVCEHRR